MSWRDAFIERFAPGGLSGCTFGDWLRILCRVRCRVDPKYWPRAALITGNSVLLSACRYWELARYRTEIEEISVSPPLFVLGIWRSGTTHLHNLLTQDDRFAFCNTYETLFPHTFLSMEKWHARSIDQFLPSARPMDNVKYGVGEPQEDEFALAASGLSFQLGIIFPRTGDYYRRFLTLDDTTPSELAAWKSALMTFLSKLTIKYKRPLVLKSPGHTARIKVLLDLFPEAKFVHIHRHPYEVFQSANHTLQKTRHLSALQNGVHDTDLVIRDYSEIVDSYFEQRHLIPKGNLCEVAFEELQRDPLTELRKVYENLQLPRFDYVESRLTEYVRALAGYERNRFADLPKDIRNRLAHEWKRVFEEWGYQT